MQNKFQSGGRLLNDDQSLADAGFAPQPYHNAGGVEVKPALEKTPGVLMPIGGAGGIIQVPTTQAYSAAPMSLPTKEMLNAMNCGQLKNILTNLRKHSNYFTNPSITPPATIEYYRQVYNLATKMYNAACRDGGSAYNLLNQAGQAPTTTQVTPEPPTAPASQPAVQSTPSCGSYTLPSTSQVDAMNCSQLQTAWNQHEANSSCFQPPATPMATYIQWQQMGTYIKGKLDVCNTPAPAPAPVIQPPNASIASHGEVTLPDGIHLTSSSTDPQNQNLSYQWDVVSGPNNPASSNPTGNDTYLSGLREGTYTFKLTVTNSGGKSSTATTNLVVHPAPVVEAPTPAAPPPQVQQAPQVQQLVQSPPVAVIAPISAITLPLNNVALDGTGSSDPNSESLTYHWQSTSGPNTPIFSNSDSSTTAATGLVAGTYTFRLTVTNTDNLNNSADITLLVNPAPAAPTPAPQSLVSVPIVPVITTPVAPYSPSLGGGGGGGGDDDSTAPMPIDNHKLRNLLLVIGAVLVAGYIFYNPNTATPIGAAAPV